MSDLVARLGLPQPRISNHLALLRDADAVLVDTDGRQRTYRLNLQRLETVLPALEGLKPAEPSRPPRSAQANREVRRNTALRQARTCYAITQEGDRALTDRQVEIPQALRPRRMFAFGCLDRTERRPHLGGALGAAILETLESAGVLRREKGSRAASLQSPVVGWLDGPTATK